MNTNTAQKLDHAANGFDIDAIRADFPVLEQEVRGKPLVYLDNAATAQKPRQVSKALAELHGGSRTLESAPGAGTTAVVRLPVARRRDYARAG